jgi:FkbM family methyltransferase
MLALAGDVYITRSLMVYGEYCPAEARVLAQVAKPGMTVIEAGANIGSHSVALARRCAPGTLYVFEPQQRLFQILCANLALNDIGNATALPEACGAEAGWASLPPVDYGGPGNFGGVSLEAEAGPARRVRVTTIDSLELEACGLIKVDVEGWEAEVLQGAAATIARCRPILYVENDRRDRQGALIDLIDGMGYRQYWHTPPLFAPDNFNGVPQNIFGPVVSCNMLCIPRERPEAVEGMAEIDPKNWASPLRAPEARP